MFLEIIALNCKVAELALQLQREILCQWANQWSLAMATAGSGRRAEPVRSPWERWTGNGPKDTDTRRETPSLEVTLRATEAPMSRRHHGNADALASAPRRVATEARPAPSPTPQICEGTKIQLHEEQLQARKQMVELGEVRVRKEVITEYKTLEVPVRREEVVIERHAPADASCAASDPRPGEEIRIAVREEQVSVEKRPVVKEEVTVGKRVIRETERVGGEVRKEEIRVEREGIVEVRDLASEACS